MDSSRFRIHGHACPRCPLCLWNHVPLSFYISLLWRYLPKYKGQTDLDISELSIINTLAICMTNLGMFLSNFKILTFPHRTVSIICVLGIAASTFTMSFCKQFYLFVIIYGIVFGLFIGYGYLAPLRNCFDYLPTRKGNFWLK